MSRRWVFCVVGGVAVMLFACSPDGEIQPSGIRLHQIAVSNPVPHYGDVTFASLAGDTLCLFDSQLVALACSGPDWEESTLVEQEGEAPGELGRSGYVVQGPGGSVLFVDVTNARASLFTTDLHFLNSVPIPPMVSPADVPPGHSVLTLFGWPTAGTISEQSVQEVDLKSGVVRRDLILRLDSDQVGGGTVILSGGIRTDDGRFLMRANADDDDYLVWFDYEGQLQEVIWPPDIGPVYPSDREIEDLSRTFRGRFGPAVAEAVTRGLKERPQGFLPRGIAARTIQVDKKGRIWVLSTRRSRDGSFLEVFGKAGHLGAIEVHGRVLGFEILDSTVVLLAEDLQPDQGDLHRRHFAWFRIVEPTGSQE